MQSAQLSIAVCRGILKQSEKQVKKIVRLATALAQAIVLNVLANPLEARQAQRSWQTNVAGSRRNRKHRAIR